jgi:O-antigen ligase
MDEREYADAHNQYMAWLVRFGLVGMLIIVGLILWPVIQFKVYRNPCFFVFLLVLAIGNLGDSNLDTHAGAYFFLFFYGLLLMNREYLYSD